MNTYKAPHSGIIDHGRDDGIDSVYFLDSYVKNNLEKWVRDVQSNDSLNPDQVDTVVSILKTGKSEHGAVYGEMPELARNGANEVDARKGIAEMVIAGGEYREAAELIMQKGVCGVHATRSSALVGIMREGALLSTARARREGYPVVTGEHFYQSGEGQEEISFSGLSHIDKAASLYGGVAAERFSREESIMRLQTRIGEMAAIAAESSRNQALMQGLLADLEKHVDVVINDPDSLEAAMAKVDFPVLFFVSGEAVAALEDEDREEGSHLMFGTSEYGEFRPNTDRLPLETLPIIAVPRQFMEGMQRLLEIEGHAGKTQVIAIESLTPPDSAKLKYGDAGGEW